MKRSDPGVLDRLARIAAGWTPPARRSDAESDSAPRSGGGCDVARPGNNRATVGLIVVVIAAALATVVWMVAGRARPVLLVPELTPNPAGAGVNHGLPDTPDDHAPVMSSVAASSRPSATRALRQNEATVRSDSLASDSIASTSAGSASPISSASSDGTLFVHVAGPVRRPGVVILPTGSRVIDAIDAAGGLRKGAEIGQTNLAAVLSDGQRIEVGAPNPPLSSSGTAAAIVDSGTQDSSSSPVDLNTATAEQLDSLPGVGPVTAAKILAWRAANGRFTSVDELSEVAGIGPVKLAELRAHVTV